MAGLYKEIMEKLQGTTLWQHIFSTVIIYIYIYTHIYIHIYICHRHEIQVKEKMMRFGCSCSNWGFWQQCWWMHRQITAFPLCMHSGFPMEKVDQTIVMSFSDVTMITCATGGGKYIRRANSSFQAVTWVSGTERLGHLLSHWPSTLAISVPLVEQEYILEELFTLFIHVQAPRLFGNTLVSTILVVWS